MTFRSVVIGLDFSPALSKVGAWLQQFLAPSADITVVHAHEPASVPSFLERLLPADQRMPGADLARVEQEVRQWCVENCLRELSIVVEAARPHDLIERVAREREADLIVVGARATDERPWQRLGSTTERLLRTAQSSVLVVHGRPTEPPHRILVAVDDVAVTSTVLSVAGALTDRFDASIHAVHVLSNAAYSHVLSIEAATSKTSTEAQAKAARDVSAETLRWLRELWQNTLRHDKLTAEVPHGNAGEEILAAAERTSADLIVIGRYGVGRVLPALLGSVVGSVTHGARCPVLVVSESASR
jgi:nucleotide-binding universal stress UspA family protein